MEEYISKILKVFHKRIQPDSDFRARSKGLILASPQFPPKRFFGLRISIFEAAKLGAALTLASFLTFIVIGGISYFGFTNTSPAALTSFDPAALSSEATSFDFKIQLGEAKYYDQSSRDIAAVLKSVSEAKSNEEIKKLLEEIAL